MKRTRKKRESMAEFRREVLVRDAWCCVKCHEFGPGYWTGQNAILDAHHLIPKQRLSGDARSDIRNGVTVHRGCHEVVEARRATILLASLPEGFADFLKEHPEAGDPVGVSKADLAVLRGEREAAA